MQKLYIFTLKENEHKNIKLNIKEVKLSDMLEKIEILDFKLKDKNNNIINAKSLNKYNKNLWIWLEESKEPTEHILNEIYNKKELFKPIHQ